MTGASSSINPKAARHAHLLSLIDNVPTPEPLLVFEIIKAICICCRKFGKIRGKYKRRKLLVSFPPRDSYFDKDRLVVVWVRMWISGSLGSLLGIGLMWTLPHRVQTAADTPVALPCARSTLSAFCPLMHPRPPRQELLSFPMDRGGN